MNGKETMGLRVENIVMSFERNVVLDGLTLDVPSMSFTTILAPTGSGKTTLLRIMAGIDKPTSGRVYYNDRDVTDVHIQERKISMVYQQFINYPSMTVYENIASPLRVSKEKLSQKEIDERVQNIAKLLKITHVLGHLPEELSGGEKQRTAIARALIKGSEFIFLDEPLANLDYKLREELRGELKTVFKGSTIVYATPEPIDALSMSSHVAYLSKGKVIQFGKVHDVYTKPRLREVGQYFNDPPMNMFDCSLSTEGGSARVVVTEELKLDFSKYKGVLREREYVMGIRPQDLSVVQNRVGMISFAASVEFTEIVGSSTTLHLIHRGNKMGIVIHQPEKQHKRGQEIRIFLDPGKVFLYGKRDGRLLIAQGQVVADAVPAS